LTEERILKLQKDELQQFLEFLLKEFKSIFPHQKKLKYYKLVKFLEKAI
jgi:hypothetical protein